MCVQSEFGILGGSDETQCVDNVRQSPLRVDVFQSVARYRRHVLDIWCQGQQIDPISAVVVQSFGPLQQVQLRVNHLMQHSSQSHLVNGALCVQGA